MKDLIRRVSSGLGMNDPTIPSSLRLALFFVLAIYVLFNGFLGFAVGPFDYNLLATYYEIAFRYWSTQQDFLGFNPFLCGGRTLGADPQIPIYHPWLLVVAILGSNWALRLEFLLSLIVAWVGFVRWLRYFKLSEAQIAWGSLLFTVGGGTLGRFAVGHVALNFFFFYPTFLWLSYRLCEKSNKKFWKYLLGYLVLFSYCGFYKPNFIIYGALPLLAEAIARSLLAKDLRPVAFFLFGLMTSGLIQSVSALPAYFYFAENTRPPDHPYSWAHWYSFFANLAMPMKTLPKKLYGGFFFLPHEATLFVGPVALFFSVRWWRAWRTYSRLFTPLLVLGLISLFLGFGSTGPGWRLAEPFTWFSSWPGFSSVRVPVRFWYGSFLLIIFLSAVGFVYPSGRMGRWVVIVFGIFPLLATFTFQMVKTMLPFDTAFRFGHFDNSKLKHVRLTNPDIPLQWVRRGIGTIDCSQNMQVYPSSDLEPGELLRVSPLEEKVNAKWLNWSEVLVSWQKKESSKISFNFNHSNYWKWEGIGGNVVSVNGERLSLQSIEKKVEGKLIFIQPYLREGKILSGIGVSILFIVGVLALYKSRKFEAL